MLLCLCLHIFDYFFFDFSTRVNYLFLSALYLVCRGWRMFALCCSTSRIRTQLMVACCSEPTDASGENADERLINNTLPDLGCLQAFGCIREDTP